MNDTVKLFARLFYYMDTFQNNSGREVAHDIIIDALKKDMVEHKMLELRRENQARIYREQLGDDDPYEKGAKEYYAKYGTSGEF